MLALCLSQGTTRYQKSTVIHYKEEVRHDQVEKIRTAVAVAPGPMAGWGFQFRRSLAEGLILVAVAPGPMAGWGLLDFGYMGDWSPGSSSTRPYGRVGIET